jgi:UDP-2-acetamido-2-deoxy-ribo-hexuluronate aminotransferase
VFGQYTIFVEDRSTVQAKLSEQGVPTAVHYPVPLNRQPAYAHLCCPDCTPNADIAAAQVMSLPMSPYLSEGDQQKVIASIKIAIGA